MSATDKPPVEPSALSAGAAESPAPLEPFEGRFELGGRGLRETAARGALINSAFQVGVVGLGLIRNVAIAAFLTASEFGLWGLIVTTLLTLAWLKQIGIGDKYIQQDEPDQVARVPEGVHARARLQPHLLRRCHRRSADLRADLRAAGDHRARPDPRAGAAGERAADAVVDPVPADALSSASACSNRSTRVVSTVLVFALAIAGYGYWSLVIGLVAGVLTAAAVAVITCPYPLAMPL